MAMAMKFEQRAADAVAKAGLRAKPGPKKGSIQNRVPKITGRAKTKHSDWNAQEISAPKSLNPMAPPWKLKKDKKNLSTAMEL
jgi:hypothetical protein